MTPQIRAFIADLSERTGITTSELTDMFRKHGKTRTPVKKFRSTPRRGEPTRNEKEAVRREVYERDQHRCTIRKHPLCVSGELPLNGSIYERFHACHIKSEGAGGKFTPENLRGGCYFCHIETEHLWGKTLTKPVPRKPEGREYEVRALATRIQAAEEKR